LLETHPEILSVITEVWNCMLHRSPPEYLVVAATPWMGVWLSLAMQPSKIPYDHNYLVEAKHPGRVNICFSKVIDKYVDILIINICLKSIFLNMAVYRLLLYI
jgi:hypothetical protein